MVEHIDNINTQVPAGAHPQTQTKSQTQNETNMAEKKEKGQRTRIKTLKNNQLVRSKLGCVNCKKKKVKCDEVHPACTRCKKRGEFCHYNFQITFENPGAKVHGEKSQTTNIKFINDKSIKTPLDLKKSTENHSLMRVLIDSKKKTDLKEVKDFSEVVKVKATK